MSRALAVLLALGAIALGCIGIAGVMRGNTDAWAALLAALLILAWALSFVAEGAR